MKALMLFMLGCALLMGCSDAADEPSQVSNTGNTESLLTPSDVAGRWYDESRGMTTELTSDQKVNITYLNARTTCTGEYQLEQATIRLTFDEGQVGCQGGVQPIVLDKSAGSLRIGARSYVAK